MDGLVAASWWNLGLWVCKLCISWPEVTGGELEMSASSRVVAVEVSGADETS